METLQPAILVRIYTDEDALSGDRPLYEVIIARAHALKLAGATVLRGRLGFGQAAILHAHHAFDLGDNLPLVIELVDEESKLRAFVAEIGDTPGIGLITSEKVEVLRYGRTASATAPPPQGEGPEK